MTTENLKNPKSLAEVTNQFKREVLFPKFINCVTEIEQSEQLAAEADVREAIDFAKRYLRLNVKAIGDYFGVSSGTVSRWSTGKTSPTPCARLGALIGIRELVQQEMERIPS